MTNNHPITPPPNLVQEWYQEADDQPAPYYVYMAHQAARWGADQELEACCEWLETGPYGFSIEATAPSMTKQLRAARRPKSPPSLKEQALEILEINNDVDSQLNAAHYNILRLALESLPD